MWVFSSKSGSSLFRTSPMKADAATEGRPAYSPRKTNQYHDRGEAGENTDKDEHDTRIFLQEVTVVLVGFALEPVVDLNADSAGRSKEVGKERKRRFKRCTGNEKRGYEKSEDEEWRSAKLTPLSLWLFLPWRATRKWNGIRGRIRARWAKGGRERRAEQMGVGGRRARATSDCWGGGHPEPGPQPQTCWACSLKSELAISVRSRVGPGPRLLT